MRNIEFLRDMLCIIDITLWECYCYILACTHFDDSGGGGKRAAVQMRFVSAVQFAQRSGVIA